MVITARSFTADFLASLVYQSEDAAVLACCFNVTPSDVEKTSAALDMAGIDYLVTTPDGVVSVDVKRRSRAYGESGNHEIVLELRSGNRPGPLFRDGPLADFLCYVVAGSPTWAYLLPMHPLRDAARVNVANWRAVFGEYEAVTANADGGYSITRFTAVPFRRVVEAMKGL